MSYDKFLILRDLSAVIYEFKLKIIQTEKSFEETKKAHRSHIESIQGLVAQLERVADEYKKQYGENYGY